MKHLDYSLKTPEERLQRVREVLEETPNPSSAYLEILANYIIVAVEKQEKKKQLLTQNRSSTINKRETSLECIAKTGEEMLYNISIHDKNVIMDPKISITKEDLETIPFLAQVRESINYWEERLSRSYGGKDAYLIKKIIIELRKDQYIIKKGYQVPIQTMKIEKSRGIKNLDETLSFDEKGSVVATGVSLMNPKAIQAVLHDYSRLKQESWDDFDGELWYFMQDFDDVADRALRPYPIYYRLLELKIDGVQSVDIQPILQEEFGLSYTVEYISSLWRNKIPKLIAAQAEDDYLTWYYTFIEKGKFKKCSRCGQIKLAHTKYFSRNNTSKDTFYSICKACRNKKGGF